MLDKLNVCCLMSLVVLMVVGLVGQTKGSPPDIDELLAAKKAQSGLAPLTTDSVRPKKDARIFSYMAPDDSPISGLVNEVYRRNLDVYPFNALKDRLTIDIPSKQEVWEKIFEERMREREADTALVKIEKHPKEPERLRLISLIETEELKRTERLCQQLEAELNAEEKIRIAKFLVKEYRLRALAFPLVRDEFDLTQDQLDAVRQGTKAMAIAIGRAIQNETYSPETSPATRAFANTLDHLDKTQIVKFFVYCDFMQEGGELSGVIDRFPPKAQNMIAEIIEKKDLEL